MIVAALLFLSQATGWVAPGAETHLAVTWLGGANGVPTLPAWGWLVRLAGGNVPALTLISVGAGLACLWFVVATAGEVFAAVIRFTREASVMAIAEKMVDAKIAAAKAVAAVEAAKAAEAAKENQPTKVAAALKETEKKVANRRARRKIAHAKAAKGMAEAIAKGGVGLVDVGRTVVVLTGLAFALTPGFFAASTRISPIMTALVPPLAAIWLAARTLNAGAAGGGEPAAESPPPPKSWRRWLGVLSLVVLAALLAAYSERELNQARLTLRSAALWTWLAVGVAPALAVAWRVTRLGLLGRGTRFVAFGVWSVAVAATGATNVTLGTLTEGRAASRVVARTVVHAEEGGRLAVVSDGAFDELYSLMLPDGIRLISRNRERDPAYGRELAAWVRSVPGLSPKLADDLAFAAELGPRALIDEWQKLDRAGFEASVAAPANLFPTRSDWEAACGELAGLRLKDPSGGRLRHFLATCGNALGCRLLAREDGDADAWEVFKAIVEHVEPRNYVAHLNLQGMIRRGFSAPQGEADRLAASRQAIEKLLKDRAQAVRTVRADGSLYVAPEAMKELVSQRREESERHELTPEQRKFAETVASAAKDPERGRAAREAIRQALREGKVGIRAFGAPLVSLDLALGDVTNAERDAVAVLRFDRHDPTANAALGALAASRGDWGAAERYLRRAIETGRASASAKNDLAYVRYRQGCFDEAEKLAREAVRMYGGHWTFHETLAAILIRRGMVDEGGRELAAAEDLAAGANVPKGTIARLEIDRARLCGAKGDRPGFEQALRSLRGRKDLTEDQRAEVEELGREGR